MASFHSWTCLILCEHIKYCLKILCMSWLYSVPDNLFKSVLFECIAFICVVFQTLAQMIVTWGQNGRTSRPQRLTNYLAPPKFSTSLSLNCVLYGQLLHLAERTHSPFNYSFEFSKYCVRICALYLLKFIVSKQEMDLIIFVTLVVHHAPNLMLCTGTSCISLGLSADHSVPF